MTKEDFGEFLKSIIDSCLKDENRNKTDLMLNIQSEIQEEIRQTPLCLYGLDVLQDSIDDEKILKMEDRYEMLDMVFAGARVDETLTYSTLLAEMELYANYSQEEINDRIIGELGYDKLPHVELQHVMMVEMEFEKEFGDICDEVEYDVENDLTSGEIFYLAGIKMLEKYGYEYNYEDEREKLQNEKELDDTL